MNAAMAPAVTARLAALREDVMKRGGSFVPHANPFLRDVALWRALRPGRSRVQVRAALLHELVKLAPISVGPGWTLAGEHLIPAPWCPLAFQGEPEAATLARIHELGVSAEEVPAVREAVRQWLGPRPGYATGEGTPDYERGRGYWGGDDSRTVYWGSGWIENHSVRDFAKVLRLGFRGIQHEVTNAMAAVDPADPELPQRENFWRAALAICEAGALLGQRYAEEATRLATTADAGERARLERMAAVCRQVPAEPATDLLSAVQALWFAHVLTCGEDGINANSIGRLDQMLQPYYEADLAAGRLDYAGAVELMQELAGKMYLEYDVQAIVLGGLDRDGNSADNAMSRAILEATRDFGTIRDVSVRLHRHSPPAFVDLAADMIARGSGIPFIFNDDCFVPALCEHGIALADARNYAPIGCIELTVPGRANPHAVSGWFCNTKCLELALFNGVDPRSGDVIGPATGRFEEYAGFDQLLAAYHTQVEYFARRMVYHCNRGELAQREGGPLPCWSTLTDDCIARGRDITDGGAVYNYHSVCFLGTANTADSLAAIRQLVFDEGRLSPGDLLAALRANFEGHEPVRQMLLRQAPKYGNDRPEVDLLAGELCEHFIGLLDQFRSPLGGRYFVHLFSFLCHLQFGRTVGATPDGRRAGEPLAYSLSAHQGRDERGVTALLNSLARLPHRRAAGASAAIVELDPVVVAGDDGVRRLAELIRSAIAMGVGQLQFNVTTAERLRQAQADPEHYGNVAVRVAGFSQMFKLVNRELQDHIIARTKHRG